MVIKKDDFINTYITAKAVHQGHLRRDGKEYFEHSKAVRNIVRKYYPKDYIAQLSALLHDTIEDYHKGSEFSTEQAVISRILEGIGDDHVKKIVIDTVILLTRSSEMTYSDYIDRLCNDTTALRVKLADIEHNLLTDPSSAQIKKYSSAINRILANSVVLDTIAFDQIEAVKKALH